MVDITSHILEKARRWMWSEDAFVFGIIYGTACTVRAHVKQSGWTARLRYFSPTNWLGYGVPIEVLWEMLYPNRDMAPCWVKDFNALSLLETISHDIITCRLKPFAHKIYTSKKPWNWHGLHYHDHAWPCKRNGKKSLDTNISIEV
jgi:hypothetical protein